VGANPIEILQKEAELERQLWELDAKERLIDFTTWTKDDYDAAPFHQSYASVLDEFIGGKIKRLMVQCPPQHGKTELCTRRMAAMMLGLNPDLRIAVIAYNHTQAAKFNRDIQRIIDSPEYKLLFPETTLSGKNIRSDAKGSWLRNSDEFEIVGRKGSLISVGLGGALTGNKVDVAIVDDPYKDAADANSQAYRNRLEEWWEAVLETRLHNGSQICLTFTRWRHDDIAGKLLELEEKSITTDKWEVVKFEAIKETFNKYDKREIGDALWPERHALQKLLNAKARNPLVFEAMYQQRPTPLGGNVVKDEWIGRYELANLPEGVNHCYIDTATSEDELKGNDPTGILVYRVWQNKLYLIHYLKGKWSMPDLVEKVKWVSDKFLNGTRSKIYIENKSNGRSTKQSLDKVSGLNVILENIKGKKLERLENELPILESKRVLIPHGDHWTADFMKQLLGFPLIEHDEEVDCLTGAIRTGLGTSGKGYEFRILGA
jgi:predicted phage terminase large subunit-like protein